MSTMIFKSYAFLAVYLGVFINYCIGTYFIYTIDKNVGTNSRNSHSQYLITLSALQ